MYIGVIHLFMCRPEVNLGTIYIAFKKGSLTSLELTKKTG